MTRNYPAPSWLGPLCAAGLIVGLSGWVMW